MDPVVPDYNVGQFRSPSRQNARPLCNDKWARRVVFKLAAVDSATISWRILTKYSPEPLKLTTDGAQHACNIV